MSSTLFHKVTMHGLHLLSLGLLTTGAWATTQPAGALPPTTSISANPAAVNVLTGNNALQQAAEKAFGIHNNHGFRFGGLWIGDASHLFSGGIPDPQRNTTNSALLLNFSLDTEKFNGWKGGLLAAEFLQFNGQDMNGQAGAIQGYNSLPAAPPFNRSELYQLWYRQRLFNDKVIMRIGKSVTTYDFDNVVKPVIMKHENMSIPATSGLIYTPMYVNGSTLGVIPGFYNSAYGIVLSVLPQKEWYLSYGIYDGNLAQGIQTGIRTLPTLNGSYFQIGEAGIAWDLGKHDMPGNIGVGAWHQSGPVTSTPNLYQTGASGLYLFGSQRLWNRHPNVDNSGITVFYQYGANRSSVLPVREYVGGGLTAYGLIPQRRQDSMGVGATLGWLNQRSYNRRTELMFQAYYQAKIINGIYLEPVVTYIPTPGADKTITPDWIGTVRAIVLF